MFFVVNYTLHTTECKKKIDKSKITMMVEDLNLLSKYQIAVKSIDKCVPLEDIINNNYLIYTCGAFYSKITEQKAKNIIREIDTNHPEKQDSVLYRRAQLKASVKQVFDDEYYFNIIKEISPKNFVFDWSYAYDALKIDDGMEKWMIQIHKCIDDKSAQVTLYHYNSVKMSFGTDYHVQFSKVISIEDLIKYIYKHKPKYCINKVYFRQKSEVV